MNRRLLAWLAAAVVLGLALPAWALSQKQEIEIGRKAVANLRKEGLREEPCLDQVGAALKRVVVRKDLPWHFWVIEAPGEYNAFAVPGGFIFITRDYYERLGDNELAFVIGHEMTHVEKKHYELARDRARTAQITSLVLGILIGGGSGARGWQTASDIGLTAYYTHYSRKLEKEADLGGFQLMQKAGYDQHGAVEAMERLKEKNEEMPRWLSQVYATHPLLSDRAERLKALAGQSPRPASDRAICKLGKPAPTKEEQAKKREAEKNRVPLALRMEDAEGKLWSNPWRKDLTTLLRTRVGESRRFRTAEQFVLYQPNVGDPVVEARKRGAKYLLTLRIDNFEETKDGAATEAGQPVTVALTFRGQLHDLDSGKLLWQAEAHRSSSGIDFLAPEAERLWPDTTASRLADSALAQLIEQADSSL